MSERDKDYYKGQLIYEKLDGVPDIEKAGVVITQLNELYEGERAADLIYWWLQARQAGLFEGEE